MQLTEAYITLKLHENIRKSIPSSDGYAEIDGTDETDLKCAAVLVPLIWQDEEWHILFTRRTDRVESHKGQVSFPGGGCNDGETTPEEISTGKCFRMTGDSSNWRCVRQCANSQFVVSVLDSIEVGDAISERSNTWA